MSELTLTQQIGAVLVIVCGTGGIGYGLWALFCQWLEPSHEDDFPGWVHRITAEDSRKREDRNWTRDR